MEIPILLLQDALNQQEVQLEESKAKDYGELSEKKQAFIDKAHENLESTIANLKESIDVLTKYGTGLYNDKKNVDIIKGLLKWIKSKDLTFDKDLNECFNPDFNESEYKPGQN